MSTPATGEQWSLETRSATEGSSKCRWTRRGGCWGRRPWGWAHSARASCWRRPGAVRCVDGLGRLAADYAPVPVGETMVARAGRHDKEMTRLGVALGGVAAAAGMALLPPRLRTPAAVAFGAGTAA
ncbi:hypothetical protein GL307_12735, partial [Nocardia seriolae]|nr:hypothetical protein [Nocardia seriolae]